MFPLPPEDLSITGYVKREWAAILLASQRGQPQAGRIAHLEVYLSDRKRDLDEGVLRAEYDWERDWKIARQMHFHYQDESAWWQVHRDKLEAFWIENANEQGGYAAAVALGGLKAIIIAHGALALAALAVLSGQVPDPQEAVQLAAKIGIVTSVIGLAAAALGQALLVHFIGEVVGRTRGVLGARRRMRRLYALGRYFVRFYRWRFDLVNLLIYGSVGIFVIGSAAAAIALLSVDA